MRTPSIHLLHSDHLAQGRQSMCCFPAVRVCQIVAVASGLLRVSRILPSSPVGAGRTSAFRDCVRWRGKAAPSAYAHLPIAWPQNWLRFFRFCEAGLSCGSRSFGVPCEGQGSSLCATGACRVLASRVGGGAPLKPKHKPNNW